MITQEESLKNLVREKYAEIANQSADFNSGSCCGAGPSTGSYTIMSENYDHLKGYNAEADLSLGCGLPTQYAKIKTGDTVIDLGSGAGNDCFVARAETGITGKVIGIDFTKVMIEKARNNAEKLGYNNVEFREGDIDNMPVNDNIADVIVSNCVLNLVPDKQKVISEIFRVLKPNGHFSISDIVLEGGLPIEIQTAAEMYAGCVSGAIQKGEYLRLIEATGFTNITIQKDRRIFLPDEILLEYLSPEALKTFLASEIGIFSITVYAEKPGTSDNSSLKKNVKLSEITQEVSCCTPGGGCC
jgi:arsenite methyltransferase